MIEEGFAQHLLADSAIAAKVDNRVHPLLLPQEPVYPALVYFRVSGQADADFEGDTGTETPRMQVSVYADTYTECVQLARLVKKALHGYSGTFPDTDHTPVQGVFLQNDIDVYEDLPNIFRRDMDFLVWHT